MQKLESPQSMANRISNYLKFFKELSIPFDSILPSQIADFDG